MSALMAIGGVVIAALIGFGIYFVITKLASKPGPKRKN